jgi:N-formylglutamate amidohydrolase
VVEKITQHSTSPLIVTIPHSGEKIPVQTPWLNALPEEVLMCDVDRYVDFLYAPALDQLDLRFVKTEWHRYAADMNRFPEDVDASSVTGNLNSAGMYNRGFHWVETTYKQPLMSEPMNQKVHQELVELIYEPFHAEVRELYHDLHAQGFNRTFHIDAHSMPSLGTSEHRDPGQLRADIVVSDCGGKSCNPRFKDLVIAAYATAGFKVAYNWPYLGGRVTELYGRQDRNQHAIQVELNRSLYMDEKTKKIKAVEAKAIQEKILKALGYVRSHLEQI